MSRLSLMILAFLFFFFLTEAKVEESLQLKVFDANYRTSNEQMQKLLDKAALETHGYKKELVTRAVSENGSDKQLFEKSRFYYKIVDCRTGLKEVNQELETLLAGKNHNLSFSNLFSPEGKWKRINLGKDGLQ